MSRVPFLDLLASCASAATEVQAALARVERSGTYLRGPEVAAFEQAWAAGCGARGAVAVSSGTDALRLALLAAGVQPGDDVVVPAFGSPYTALAVRGAGAQPVFADVDADTWNVTTESVAAARTARTRAAVLVHLFGRRAAIDVVDGVRLIEDCAHAHGLSPGARRHTAAYSFYPTKNLGALGDAGCLVSDDQQVLERARLWREGGQAQALRGSIATGVARMDELQAAVLLARRSHLAAWNARRRALAERYLHGLADCAPLRLPAPAAAEDHVWHLFVVEHPTRDRLIAKLAEQGVDAAIHYAPALHQLPLFAGCERRLPAAEHAASHVLSLPLHPGLSDAAADQVIDAVRRSS